MQGEDDLRGLAKIMAFMRAVSIIIVLMHLYWFCYGFFINRGWTLEIINKKYGEDTVTLELKDQYYNMREKIEPVMHIIDIAFKAMEEAGVTPKVKAIRGGTDGAQLSFKGLPCPNIFAGGLNFHGRYEFVPIQSIEKAMKVVVKIAELVAR